MRSVASEAHDRTRCRGPAARVDRSTLILKGDIGQVGKGLDSARRVVLTVVPVVLLAHCGVERPIERVPEARAALVVKSSVAVTTPTIHPFPVRRMSVDALHSRIDIDTRTQRCWRLEERDSALDDSGTLEHTKGAAPVRVVTTRATQLARGKRAPRSHVVANVGKDPVGGSDDVVSCRRSRYRVQAASGSIVQIIFQQEDEITPAFLQGRYQRIVSQNRSRALRMTHQTDVAGAATEELKIVAGTRRNRPTVSAVVEGVTPSTAGHTACVERSGWRGHNDSENRGHTKKTPYQVDSHSLTFIPRTLKARPRHETGNGSVGRFPSTSIVRAYRIASPWQPPDGAG